MQEAKALLRPTPLITVPSQAALPHTFWCLNGDRKKQILTTCAPSVLAAFSHSTSTAPPTLDHRYFISGTS